MESGFGPTREADVVVVGAGVLGISLAYWLSSEYGCRIVVLEMERNSATHTSSRNTGVIHRPFYLDPVKKKVFARSAGLSYSLWKGLAEKYGLPWNPVGTLNVALTEQERNTISKYADWGQKNGMDEAELALLDGDEVRSMEPEVSCGAALLSRTDVSVDFGTFSRGLQVLAERQGVTFVHLARVSAVRSQGGGIAVSITSPSGPQTFRGRFLVNSAGGGALDIAHSCGLGLGYAALNFRGEYWVVDDPFASKMKTNVYRPPRYPQFPFLDPHLVVRADGSRQIGPNAALVAGPYVYSGFGLSRAHALLSRPPLPKVSLLADPFFVALLAGEWRSSLSKRAMCGRVSRFVPRLHHRMLNKRAVFGVRSSLVGKDGFVPEALLLEGEASAHVVNFNSPGATGAPAYAAALVTHFRDAGYLDGLPKRNAPPPDSPWDFESIKGGLPEVLPS